MSLLQTTQHIVTTHLTILSVLRVTQFTVTTSSDLTTFTKNNLHMKITCGSLYLWLVLDIFLSEMSMALLLSASHFHQTHYHPILCPVVRILKN